MQTQEKNVLILFLYSNHYSTLKDMSSETNKKQKYHCISRLKLLIKVALKEFLMTNMMQKRNISKLKSFSVSVRRIWKWIENEVRKWWKYTINWQRHLFIMSKKVYILFVTFAWSYLWICRSDNSTFILLTL